MRMLGVLLQGCAAESCPTFFGSPQESPTSSYFLAISTSVRPRFKRKDARLGEGHCTLAGQHFHAPLWSFDHAELMWYAT